MTSLLRALRDRLLPAVLTAAGVTLIAAGMLSYTGSAAGPAGSAAVSPQPSTVSNVPGASFRFPSLPPIDASPPPSVAPPSADPNRVATRIVIEALDIDLPWRRIGQGIAPLARRADTARGARAAERAFRHHGAAEIRGTLSQAGNVR